MAIHTIQLDLELDEESGIYTVTSPDVPGLVTEGSTPNEILQNVQEAVDALILGWAELGRDLPPALRNPVAPRHADIMVAV